MRIKKTDKVGTIHELAVQLANIAQQENINPVTIKDRNTYKKIFEKYDLFPKNSSQSKKNEIISKLRLLNFKLDEIIEQKEILNSVIQYNKLIEKERIKIEKEIRSGKDVKNNDLRLRNIEPVEINIPRDIRNNLKIYNKSVKLFKYNVDPIKNKIKFYSGQNYNFLIKDGFSKPYEISYDELQKIRKEGNVVDFILKKFKNSVDKAFEKDKLKYSRKEPQKWKAKQKVYKKIYKVIEHNEQIANNKKYNKKLVSKDSSGKIEKNNSEYPVLMDIYDEVIETYIP